MSSSWREGVHTLFDMWSEQNCSSYCKSQETILEDKAKNEMHRKNGDTDNCTMKSDNWSQSSISSRRSTTLSEVSGYSRRNRKKVAFKAAGVNATLNRKLMKMEE